MKGMACDVCGPILSMKMALFRTVNRAPTRLIMLSLCVTVVVRVCSALRSVGDSVHGGSE